MKPERCENMHWKTPDETKPEILEIVEEAPTQAIQQVIESSFVSDGCNIETVSNED